MLLRLSLLASCILLAMAAAGCSSADPRLRLDGRQGAIYWPPPPNPPRIEYLQSISGPDDIDATKSRFRQAVALLFGEEEEGQRIVRPYGLAARDDRLVATDPGARLVHFFDRQQKKALQISSVGGHRLISPTGVALDRKGRIYLSDSVLRKVFLLDSKGGYLGEFGTGETFVRPAGLAVDDTRLYVVDTHAHRVLVFGVEDGRLLFEFGGNGAREGEFNFPTNIFVSRDGLVHVTDSMNFRVQIFAPNGVFLDAFGKAGDGAGDFAKPKGLGVDSDGQIYVADAHFDSVQIFDRQGRLLLDFGNYGRGPGEMILPSGLFIDENDLVYVADSYNGRIHLFRYLKETR